MQRLYFNIRHDSQANHDLGLWAGQLGQKGFVFEALNLSDEPQIPADSRVLILASPQTPLLPGGRCQASCVCRSTADRSARADPEAREAAEVMEGPILRSLPAGAGSKPPLSGIG